MNKFALQLLELASSRLINLGKFFKSIDDITTFALRDGVDSREARSLFLDIVALHQLLIYARRRRKEPTAEIFAFFYAESSRLLNHIPLDPLDLLLFNPAENNNINEAAFRRLEPIIRELVSQEPDRDEVIVGGAVFYNRYARQALEVA